MALTPKQRRFVGEYLKDLNATAAARRAGFSQRTASEIGYEYLRKPHIRAEVEKRTAEQFTALNITAERILWELSLLAFANVPDYAEVGFRYADKIRALELLGKYRALFTERYELAEPEIDLSKLTDEELEQLERLYEKCGIAPYEKVSVHGGVN